ncbi:MAG: TetR/AcrR family transcriptional regulator [Rhodocyclaceae bacterium]|nr:TetR/AcrR family transcriptional regulator [Rhodocyclaceae bacterium]
MKAANPPIQPTNGDTPALRLSRDDWLDAAFETVAESGFDSVRILTLAAALGVTRGSFYWHFTDHAELISALVERWRMREVDTHQRAQEARPLEPKADLERMLEAALAHAGAEIKYLRFGLALRGLGRSNPDVAAKLVEVDRMRMRLFETKFLRLTGDEKTAGELAALFYLAIVGGTHALARPANPERTKDYLQRVIGHYLIAAQIPEVAQ